MKDEEKKMSMTGECLCGAVKFEADNVQTHHHACHCDTCRHWSGSPTMAASVEKVTFTGEENITLFSSSDWAERGFCRKCGTHLFYRLKENAQTVMWVGSFDDQSAFRLVGEIYIDSKPEGYDFQGDHPRLTEKEFLQSIGVPVEA